MATDPIKSEITTEVNLFPLQNPTEVNTNIIIQTPFSCALSSSTRTSTSHDVLPISIDSKGNRGGLCSQGLDSRSSYSDEGDVSSTNAMSSSPKIDDFQADAGVATATAEETSSSMPQCSILDSTNSINNDCNQCSTSMTALENKCSSSGNSHDDPVTSSGNTAITAVMEEPDLALLTSEKSGVIGRWADEYDDEEDDISLCLTSNTSAIISSTTGADTGGSPLGTFDGGHSEDSSRGIKRGTGGGSRRIIGNTRSQQRPGTNTSRDFFHHGSRGQDAWPGNNTTDLTEIWNARKSNWGRKVEALPWVTAKASSTSAMSGTTNTSSSRWGDAWKENREAGTERLPPTSNRFESSPGSVKPDGSSKVQPPVYHVERSAKVECSGPKERPGVVLKKILGELAGPSLLDVPSDRYAAIFGSGRPRDEQIITPSKIDESGSVTRANDTESCIPSEGILFQDTHEEGGVQVSEQATSTLIPPPSSSKPLPLVEQKKKVDPFGGAKPQNIFERKEKEECSRLQPSSSSSGDVTNLSGPTHPTFNIAHSPSPILKNHSNDNNSISLNENDASDDKRKQHRSISDDNKSLADQNLADASTLRGVVGASVTTVIRKDSTAGSRLVIQNEDENMRQPHITSVESQQPNQFESQQLSATGNNSNDMTQEDLSHTLSVTHTEEPISSMHYDTATAAAVGTSHSHDSVSHGHRGIPPSYAPLATPQIYRVSCDPNTSAAGYTSSSSSPYPSPHLPPAVVSGAGDPSTTAAANAYGALPMTTVVLPNGQPVTAPSAYSIACRFAAPPTPTQQPQLYYPHQFCTSGPQQSAQPVFLDQHYMLSSEQDELHNYASAASAAAANISLQPRYMDDYAHRGSSNLPQQKKIHSSIGGSPAYQPTAILGSSHIYPGQLSGNDAAVTNTDPRRIPGAISPYRHHHHQPSIRPAATTAPYLHPNDSIIYHHPSDEDPSSMFQGSTKMLPPPAQFATTSSSYGGSIATPVYTHQPDRTHPPVVISHHIVGSQQNQGSGNNSHSRYPSISQQIPSALPDAILSSTHCQQDVAPMSLSPRHQHQQPSCTTDIPNSYANSSTNGNNANFLTGTAEESSTIIVGRQILSTTQKQDTLQNNESSSARPRRLKVENRPMVGDNTTHNNMNAVPYQTNSTKKIVSKEDSSVVGTALTVVTNVEKYGTTVENNVATSSDEQTSSQPNFSSHSSSVPQRTNSSCSSNNNYVKPHEHHENTKYNNRGNNNSVRTNTGGRGGISRGRGSNRNRIMGGMDQVCSTAPSPSNGGQHVYGRRERQRWDNNYAASSEATIARPNRGSDITRRSSLDGSSCNSYKASHNVAIGSSSNIASNNLNSGVHNVYQSSTSNEDNKPTTTSVTPQNSNSSNYTNVVPAPPKDDGAGVSAVGLPRSTWSARNKQNQQNDSLARNHNNNNNSNIRSGQTGAGRHNNRRHDSRHHQHSHEQRDNNNNNTLPTTHHSSSVPSYETSYQQQQQQQQQRLNATTPSLPQTTRPSSSQPQQSQQPLPQSQPQQQQQQHQVSNGGNTTTAPSQQQQQQQRGSHYGKDHSNNQRLERKWSQRQQGGQRQQHHNNESFPPSRANSNINTKTNNPTGGGGGGAATASSSGVSRYGSGQLLTNKRRGSAKEFQHNSKPHANNNTTTTTTTTTLQRSELSKSTPTDILNHSNTISNSAISPILVKNSVSLSGASSGVKVMNRFQLLDSEDADDDEIND